MSNDEISGAEIILKSLGDLGVDVIFGYPGFIVHDYRYGVAFLYFQTLCHIIP